MFAIVEFEKSNPNDIAAIEIVHSDWVLNGQVYFPASNRYRTFINMKVSDADYKTWKLYNCCVLKINIATMDDAKVALAKYIAFNGSQSESENHKAKLTNRKHPTRKYNLQKNYNLEFETVAYTYDEKSPEESVNVIDVLNTEVAETSSLSSVLSDAILTYNDVEATTTINVNRNNSFTSNLNNNNNDPLGNTESKYANILSGQANLEDKLNKICSMMVAIELKIDRLIEGGSQIIDASDKPQLNFKTIDDLTNFETRLKEDTNYRLKITSYFVNIAHKGLSKDLNIGLTKSILVVLVDPSLAAKISWSGRNKDLPGFVIFKTILEMILDVLKRRNVKAIVTQDDVRHAVQEFLKRV